MNYVQLLKEEHRRTLARYQGGIRLASEEIDKLQAETKKLAEERDSLRAKLELVSAKPGAPV